MIAKDSNVRAQVNKSSALAGSGVPGYGGGGGGVGGYQQPVPGNEAVFQASFFKWCDRKVFLLEHRKQTSLSFV